jgi:hypothetical protein
MLDLSLLHSRKNLSHAQLVNKMCLYCLFPVVDKSGTSCCHLVTRLMRPTNSQQVVPTSLISSACINKLLTSCRQQARSNLLRTACINLVIAWGTPCSRSVAVIMHTTSQQDDETSSAITSWYRVEREGKLAT